MEFCDVKMKILFTYLIAGLNDAAFDDQREALNSGELIDVLDHRGSNLVAHQPSGVVRPKPK